MANHPFTYQPLPVRVVFGPGRRQQLAAEAQRLGLKRVLVLSTPGQANTAEHLAALLGGLAAGTFSGATMHTPTAVTEQALRVVHDLNADGVVAIGGGSATGLSKAIARRTGLPQIILPTTYAGSEMTPVLGETSGGRKTVIRDQAVLPKTVIYDVELTLTLPPAVSASSGMNALAHAAEALYAHNGNPLVSVLAEEAIRALGQSLPRIRHSPQDLEARSQALSGAWLAGSVLGSVDMALHHKLAHVLGGTFILPHAELHAALLPHTLAYNAQAAPEAMNRIARALGRPDEGGPDPTGRNAPQLVAELNRRLGIESALKNLGLPEAGLDEAVTLALQNPDANPAPLEREALRELLQRAWSGQAPR